MNRDEALLRRVHETLSMDDETLAQQIHPDFNRYFRHLLRNSMAVKRYVGEIDYLVSRCGLRGQVLDLASGFGLTAICLKLLGVDNVTCIDVAETKVTAGGKLARLVQVDGCAFHRGDGRGLPFEDESFDCVLIKDAVSHFRDPMGVWTEVIRVLKPGGRLTIVDDRNQRNPHVVAGTRKIWEMSETGSARELSRLGIDVAFTKMRHDYIAQRFPQLEDGEIALAADMTRGFTFEMLDRAVPFILEGKTPDMAPLAPCINPESGIVQERLVDPLHLARDLGRLGLRARIVLPVQWDPRAWLDAGGDWKGLWARLAVQAIWPVTALRPILLRRMNNFVIVGLKRGESVQRAIGTT
jgi:ubiquinone/menaquinone biosynthesis C-methylase UbiE